MLKIAPKPKSKLRSIHLMSKEELSAFMARCDEHTKCENALIQLRRALATLEILRDAAENGECFDGKTASDALMFINDGIRREIVALDQAILPDSVGGANV